MLIPPPGSLFQGLYYFSAHPWRYIAFPVLFSVVPFTEHRNKYVRFCLHCQIMRFIPQEPVLRRLESLSLSVHVVGGIKGNCVV